MRKAVKPIMAFLLLNCLLTGIHVNVLANDTKIDSTIQDEIPKDSLIKMEMFITSMKTARSQRD